ncbi:7549_t:CDS:10 [Ambispora gerdemannii]|uniref:7549_t:CDS:1 n=1 Tax=Ambispora gerdemannii TaxID=144530 RepID=A0A9N8WJM0_9GLOM|nr:7549_t:CDS:10 [Ambispora gerdemannii]
MDDSQQLNFELLTRLLVTQLKDVCRLVDLKVGGTKAVLAGRIEEYIENLREKGDSEKINFLRTQIDRFLNINRMSSSSTPLPNQGSINRVRINYNNGYNRESNKETKSGGSYPSNCRPSYSPYSTPNYRKLPPPSPSLGTPLNYNHNHHPNPYPFYPNNDKTSSSSLSTNNGGRAQPQPILKLPPNLPLNYFQNIIFKRSPFYEVVERVTTGKVCNASNEKYRIFVDFFLTHSHLNKINPKYNENSGKYQIRFFSCAAPETTHYMSRNAHVALVEFPAMCELYVNGDQLQTSLRGLKNKPGTVQPPDITAFCNMNVKNSNKIEFVYANAVKPYLVMVQIVRSISVESIVEEIKRNRLISKEEVLQQLRKDAEDPDLVATSSVISLKDPLCHLRINTPCRSVNCHHIQCFDIVYYFQMNEQTPTWTCPVCNNILNSWEEIALDGYFADILDKVPPDQETIIIEANGRWELTSPPEPIIKVPQVIKNVENNQEIYIIDDSDEETQAETINITSSSNKENNKPIIIDLTLDSESEDDENNEIEDSERSVNSYIPPSPTNQQPPPLYQINPDSQPSPIYFDYDNSKNSNDSGVGTTPQTSSLASPIMGQYYYDSISLLNINSINPNSIALFSNENNDAYRQNHCHDHGQSDENSWEQRTIEEFYP